MPVKKLNHMRYYFLLIALFAFLSAPPKLTTRLLKSTMQRKPATVTRSRGMKTGAPISHYQPHRCKNRYGYYGWVGKYHQVVIPFEYQEFPEYLSGFNPAKKGGKYGAVNTRGKAVIPFKYTSLDPYYGQQLAVCRDASYKISVFDFEGRVILARRKAV